MSRRGSSLVLVGRATELAALETAFETVRQGGPAALLIGGEAGVGKTRLMAEFAARARAAGARVLAGYCLELGAEGLSFGPFTAMLRDLVRELGAEEIVGLLPGSGRTTRELARLLPELAAGRAAGEAGGFRAWQAMPPVASGLEPGGGAGVAVPDPLPPSGTTAGEARARLFEEFLTLLERLAAQRPLVLLVEDLHWADRSSRDLLAFLIGYQRALRNVLIAVTFRSDELHRTHPLRPLLAELARIDWVERTELPRLTRGQAEELAGLLLGRVPDQAVIDALYQRAEGNPLFTEELLACSDGCDVIPDSLADLLLQAVRRLPEGTQEVLRVASAGSGAVSHALLATVTGRTADELTAAIRPAVAANVLVTTSDGYAFRHALISEAVHEDLLPGEHSGVHTRFALAIEADPSLAADGRADVERAHHWYAAHNTQSALSSAWRACTQPACTVALAERLMLLARVLELWDQVPDAAARIGADHVRVLEEAAAAAHEAGEHKRGLAFTESALAELDEATEPVRVALLIKGRHRFRRDLGLPANEADIRHALDLVPAEVSPKARTELLLAAAHCEDNQALPLHRAWAEEALRLSREAGDSAAEAEALIMLAMLAAGPGQAAAPGSEALRILAEAKAITQRGEVYQPTIKAVIIESHLLCGAGAYDLAAAAAQRGIADAERFGLARTAGALLALNQAEPLFCLGRWEEAAEVTERALDLAPPSFTRAGLWIISGEIALARGDLVTAARRATAGRAVVSGAAYECQHHLPQAVLDIEMALATDGRDAAVEVAAHAVERYDLSSGTPRYVWPLLVTAAWVATAAGGDAAAALLDRLRLVARKLESSGPVQRAWQLSFAVAALRPEDESMASRLAAADAAVAAWEAVGQPYPAAVTLVNAARGVLACHGTREAASLLRRAAPIAERLGARLLAGEIADLARRAGEVRDATSLGLTHRELEVLRLIATGRSNREIAATLVISPKTASVHVSNILAKLGTATRTEAAVKAQQLLLLDLPA